jgi:hypothetical protein
MTLFYESGFHWSFAKLIDILNFSQMKMPYIALIMCFLKKLTNLPFLYMPCLFYDATAQGHDTFFYSRY